MKFEDNIVHYSRHVPFTSTPVVDNDWWIGGYDWSAGDATLVACDAPGGTAKITLTKQAAGTEGLSLFYDPNWTSPDGIVMGGTRIRPLINEGTLEGLANWATAPSTPLVLYYDLLLTPPSVAQFVLAYGTLTINPGEAD